MQQRPDLTSLIEAVQTYLRTEVRPAVQDRAIRFRLLIASNLLEQVAAELRNEDRLRTDELASLSALLEEKSEVRDTSGTQRQQEISAMDSRLTERIRSATTKEHELSLIRQHLLATLGATLAVTDPSFDLSMNIE